MRRAAIAAVFVVGVLIALTTGATAQTEPASAQCVPAKRVFAEAQWRDAKPRDGRDVCHSPGADNTKAHFYLYRHYRQITPYRCLRGREGTFAIPCYIIECESHFNWWAHNPSGASYIYQLLGWGAPPPNSFRNRVRNHEIAHSLSLSNWACA
jgi:hypothetical protein